jgi:hypothetical protein
MVGPLWVLAVGPAVATTKDVDGGPPVGCCRDFWQRPPLMLKTSTAAPWPPWRYEVIPAKKMLAVTSDLGGCWPRAPTTCTDPQAPLIITGLGQFSVALAGEVSKALVRGVHHPGP